MGRTETKYFDIVFFNSGTGNGGRLTWNWYVISFSLIKFEWDGEWRERNERDHETGGKIHFGNWCADSVLSPHYPDGGCTIVPLPDCLISLNSGNSTSPRKYNRLKIQLTTVASWFAINAANSLATLLWRTIHYLNLKKRGGRQKTVITQEILIARFKGSRRWRLCDGVA